MRERFVLVTRRRVRVLEVGRRGPPVLLFHGAGGWAETWGEVPSALAAAGYHAFACDLPGFGESEPPSRPNYFHTRRSFYVRWTLRLMDALRLRRAALVGHSLGGTVSMLTAAMAPERVPQLALLAPGGFGDSVGFRLRMMALPFSDRVAPYVPEALVRSFLRSNVRDPACIPPWLYADACRYARRCGAEFARVMSQGLAMFGSTTALRDAWAERLARLPIPTLVLWGREDRTLPVSHALQAAATLPGAVVEVIPDAGHLLMLEKPRFVCRALLAFLSAGPARASARAQRGPPLHAREPEVLDSGTGFAMQPVL